MDTEQPAAVAILHEFVGGFSLAMLAAIVNYSWVWSVVVGYAVVVFGLSAVEERVDHEIAPDLPVGQYSDTSIEWAGAFLFGVVVGSVTAGLLGLAVPGWGL